MKKDLLVRVYTMLVYFRLIVSEFSLITYISSMCIRF